MWSESTREPGSQQSGAPPKKENRIGVSDSLGLGGLAMETNQRETAEKLCFSGAFFGAEQRKRTNKHGSGSTKIKWG